MLDLSLCRMWRDKPGMWGECGCAGSVGEILVCMLAGAYEGWTWDNPACVKRVSWCHLNWMNRKPKNGSDKRASITMKEKRSSGRKRAPPGLAIHRSK